MAKQSEPQKEVVERVMHEFKHGELETAAGRKVTNPKQAIAIGLREAGASDEVSPKQNKQNLKRTKARERGGATGRQQAEGGPSKAELYAQAKKRDIPGRSKMDKAQLERALAK
jgi:hypothetical protein